MLLQTLTPEAADPGNIVRSAAAGQAVTIQTPVIGNELRTVRVPVQLTPTDVQYVTNLQWVDTPDKLFQSLVEETVRRTTNRVVLDPNQTGVDPGVVVQGELPSDRSAAADQLAGLADAGATWWVESRWNPETATPESLLDAIHQGPPRP